ncbi:hypothetical protein BJV78DRAFT_1182864 [Lactifluus subvellereus]|nr:hypothetical protein BJV78DRAFT_1182864 [Lactifluus subvellereus]
MMLEGKLKARQPILAGNTTDLLWMDITGLLNLAVETTNTFSVTDRDIMMDAKRLWEGAAASGGNDDNIDVPAPGPVTTCCEALWAALTLRKYVRTFNGPFACKLEVMLGLFGQ